MIGPAVVPASAQARPAAPTAATRRFHRRVLAELDAADIPCRVGGSHALEHYLCIGRSVRDLDLFMRERDMPDALRRIEERLGYRTEVTFPHWLAKIRRGDQDCIDVIFNSGNGV